MFKLGHKHSEETKRKIGLTNKGRIYTKEQRKYYEDYWNSKKGKPTWNKGKQLTQEHINNLIKNHKGMLNKKHSEKTKEKQRISHKNYIEKYKGNYRPNIGRYEKLILDGVEKFIKFKILRQFFVKGYFLDGYIPELNLAIEVDERPKISEKEKNREKIIREELDCSFVRIPLYRFKIEGLKEC